MNRFFSLLLTAALTSCVALLLTAQGAEDARQDLVMLKSIPLPQVTGGMNHLAADAKRKRVFVTATTDKSVVVIDAAVGKVLHVIEGVRPAAAAFAADLDQLYVSGDSRITIYDGDTFKSLGVINLHRTVDELRYVAKQKRLYAGLMDTDNPAVAIIDPAGKKVLGEVKLPAKPQGFEVEENGNRIFANTPGAGQVTVIDRLAMKVTAEWKLREEGNYPLALDEKGHRLFVGCRRPEVIVMFDTETGRQVACIGSRGDTDDVSFDPSTKRVYASCGDGAIVVGRQVDADRYERMPDVGVQVGARNSILVTELGWLCLAVPHSEGKDAQLQVFEFRR